VSDDAPVPPKPSEEETGDLVFDTLWKRAIEEWDDDKRHAAVLDYALRSERLPDLAGRYRALKDDAQKGERATKKLDALVVAATQMMMAMKTPPRQKPPAFLTFTALLLFLALMGLLYYAVFTRHG
jgi:hypothetical protein